MDTETVRRIYKHVSGLVITTGAYVRSATSQARLSTEAKENYSDLVTEYDKNTEQKLFEDISKHYPDHKFIGEESVSSGEKCELTDEPTWIIDPIDGTTNFVHTTPFYAISMALFVKKEAVLGFVYNIPRDELYSALRGEGAFCNGRPIQVSETKELKKALIIAEYGNQRDEGFLQFKIDQMAKLVRKCHGIRCFGSAALNACAVACGQADAYYEFGLHIWDMAAAYLIVEEAGGISCDPSGAKLDLLSRKFMVANSQELANEMSSLIGGYEVERD